MSYFSPVGFTTADFSCKYWYTFIIVCCKGDKWWMTFALGFLLWTSWIIYLIRVTRVQGNVILEYTFSVIYYWPLPSWYWTCWLFPNKSSLSAALPVIIERTWELGTRIDLLAQDHGWSSTSAPLLLYSEACWSPSELNDWASTINQVIQFQRIATLWVKASLVNSFLNSLTLLILWAQNYTDWEKVLSSWILYVSIRAPII